jgi:polysaccharide biosynthesis/export protein
MRRAERPYKARALQNQMRGGEQVVVEADPRFFLSLGATGQEKMVPFSKASHRLLEALLLSNVLSEGRSTLKGVLVLATESPIPSAGSVLGLFGNVLGIASRVGNF